MAQYTPDEHRGSPGAHCPARRPANGLQRRRGAGARVPGAGPAPAGSKVHTGPEQVVGCTSERCTTRKRVGAPPRRRQQPAGCSLKAPGRAPRSSTQTRRGVERRLSGRRQRWSSSSRRLAPRSGCAAPPGRPAKEPGTSDTRGKAGQGVTSGQQARVASRFLLGASHLGRVQLLASLSGHPLKEAQERGRGRGGHGRGEGAILCGRV